MTSTRLPARLLGATLLTAALLGTPAVADPLKSKTPVASEAVTPTASGPKPYHAALSGECSLGVCEHNFGKKGNKIRKIDLVACGMITPTEQGLYAMIYFDAEVQFIVPIGSRGVSATSDYSMFEFQYKFAVPEGRVLRVLFFSGGTPSTSLCTISGTIE